MTECWRDCLFQGAATLECLECIFAYILNVAVGLAGVAAFIALVIGGFQYLTAGGDPKKAESASNTITYAVLGLVILLLTWFGFYFISKFTGVNITIFEIGD